MAAVLFVVLMDIVGIGIISPLFPFYAMRVGASPGMVTLCMALYSAALFLSAPLLGKLSDRYGRKKIMVISLLGSIGGYALLMYASNIWLIALSRVLGGAMAGNFSAAQAYIVDHTDETARPKMMGLFGAAMGLGFVLGPVLGSWLGGDSFSDANFFAPALVAILLSMLGLLGVIFLVKEKKFEPVRRESQKVSRFSLSSALREARIDENKGELLIKAAICIILYTTAAGLYETIFPIWAKDHAIVSGPKGLLPIFLAGGLGYVLIQVFIGKIVKENNERTVLIAGVLLYMAANLLMPVSGNHANTVAVILLTGITACAAGLIFSTSQIIVSRCAAPQARGFVFGTVNSLGMLGKTLAIAASGFIYSHVGSHAPYFVAAGLALFLLMNAYSINTNAETSRVQEASEP